MTSTHGPFVLGVTGASGAIYALRLLQVLIASGRDVHLSLSASGQTLLEQELGINVDLKAFRATDLLTEDNRLAVDEAVRRRFYPETNSAAPPGGATLAEEPGEIHYYHFTDFMAPIASGSFLTGGMVICPCSGGTLSAVAAGSSHNLISRAAEVHLKERRPLVLSPRETPLSLIQIENMRRCAEAGAVLLPAMPGFYHAPQSQGDLVDFIVARICDQLGVQHRLMQRWGGQGGPASAEEESV